MVWNFIHHLFTLLQLTKTTIRSVGFFVLTYVICMGHQIIFVLDPPLPLCALPRPPSQQAPLPPPLLAHQRHRSAAALRRLQGADGACVLRRGQGHPVRRAHPQCQQAHRQAKPLPPHRGQALRPVVDQETPSLEGSSDELNDVAAEDSSLDDNHGGGGSSSSISDYLTVPSKSSVCGGGCRKLSIGTK